MEKQKRWQFAVILAVIFLTVYNILPTLFFYSKPLKEPINQEIALGVADQISLRVNGLEKDAQEWTLSFSKNLGIAKPTVIFSEENPRFITLKFGSAKDAQLFKRFLPRAGLLIPFVPSQLELSSLSADTSSDTLILQRRIGIHMPEKELSELFSFIPKFDDQGHVTPLYRGLVFDRLVPLITALGSPNTPSQDSQAIASKIVLIDHVFGADSPFAKRYFASLGPSTALVTALNKEGKIFEQAKAVVEQNKSAFETGQDALSADRALKLLEDNFAEDKEKISLNNPFISSLMIDWREGLVLLTLRSELVHMRDEAIQSESASYYAQQVSQLLFDEIAHVSRATQESFTSENDDYLLKLDHLTNSQSLLAMDLNAVAKEEAAHLEQMLKGSWHPESRDFQGENFPILDAEEFAKLPKAEQKLGLVVFTPKGEAPAGFKSGSIYIIAKGVQPLFELHAQNLESESSKQLMADFSALRDLLASQGFFGYPAATFGFDTAFSHDYIFELDDYYSTLLKATREQFFVHGSRRYATLEFTDVQQRLLTLNRIEDQIHEDLLKWKDAYHAALVDLNLRARYDVPPPTKSVIWDNFKLSAKKYFRGDDRKVLKWGLDLSGGKTVRIGLKDQNGRPVTDPVDLREGVNELYKRVNKLGLSEVGIRSEGKNIVLDFPGSQGLSASELVKASSMSFHVVNEKFSPLHRELADSVNAFLQEVWNEAVVTNRKSVDEINLIAWQHLGGADEIPQSEAARKLYEQGLRFAGPNSPIASSTFNDTLSSIGMFKGDDFAQWQGQSHPLLIIFHNYALEGSRLQNIQAGYDPSKGNILSFGVVGSGKDSSGQRTNARDELFAWTSKFAQDKILGTPKEEYSQGNGWRMAVILNGSIVSAPTLNSALRDHAMISGHFSQREVNQLAADLKAGSLSFTPKILSEQNVSPDLGQEERMHGIWAAVLGTVLVIVAMIIGYRFAGLVASIAVLFLLLLMWGILQNLDAALTLPGIAGIILSIGMAVDANVLVYERIREEFKITERLPSAVQAGYRKAFSAIVDSNLTTIIAALILLQFDSGPIKGFALTLIIGIVASMFTSLFMTRYFFAGWVQNPTHKKLSMSNFVGQTTIDFLKKAKSAIILSLAVIVIGSFFMIASRHTMVGMDFTGGYSLHLTLPTEANMDYKAQVTKALVDAGAAHNDFQIRTLNTPNNLRVQFAAVMNQPGHPFYGLPQELPASDQLAVYELNPRINWVVASLEKSGIHLSEDTLALLPLNWNEMSGQLSDTMLTNALIALGLALLAVLIYITVRFEFKYAISAIIGLVHDVLITLAILGVLHFLGVPIQIDLQVIAALMTLIGYSLNDTIIIFDRIREELRTMRKMPFNGIVNHALNATLGRTLMTSGTTLLALLALLVLGGSTIFNFALVMTLGVIIGTLSSLFIAAPLLLYFHNKEIAKENGSMVAKGATP